MVVTRLGGGTVRFTIAGRNRESRRGGLSRTREGVRGSEIQHVRSGRQGDATPSNGSMTEGGQRPGAGKVWR